MNYILKDYYKIINKNIEKCQEAIAKINENEVTENKNLTNSVYVLINEKEEDSLFKENLGELEDLYYEEDDIENNNEDIDENDESSEIFY